MNKKLLTLAVAVAVAAPMTAMAEAVMYGKVRQAVEYVDGDAVADGQWQIRDYVSRIGVKGSEDLGGGLKAIYKLEFGVNISSKIAPTAWVDNNPSEFGSQENAVTGRNAYVGLAGDWGTFLVGRHDTPLKISSGSLDYFSDQAGDYNTSVTGAKMDLFGFQDRRANGTVAYITPNMGGMTVAAAIVPGEETGTPASDLADAYSVAAMYSNSGFFASAAYEGGEYATNDVRSYGDGPLDQWRLGLGFDGGDFKVATAYENQQLDHVDIDRWMINGAYNFGNNTVKAKYQNTDDGAGGALGGGDMWSIGFDHNFTKRTQFVASYSDYSADAANSDAQIFSLGLNHEF